MAVVATRRTTPYREWAQYSVALILRIVQSHIGGAVQGTDVHPQQSLLLSAGSGDRYTSLWLC